jgi:hypothetical protein
LIEQDKHFFVTSYQDAGWYNGYLGYVMRGDTIVQDVEYTKIYRQIFEAPEEPGIYVGYEPPYELRYEELFALMREDVEERKVYTRIYEDTYPIEWECDDSYELGDEILYYDFSQTIGDTISFCSTAINNFDYTLILGAVSFEEVWGEERRRFNYFQNETDGHFYTFEGIGGLEGIFSSINGISVDKGWYKLLNICTGTNEECGIVDLVSIENILPLANEIKLSPNPTSGQINLKLSEIISEKGKFQISDLTGRVVYLESLKSGEYIRQLDLPKGFYSASFQQNGQILWQNKLIVLH